MDSKLSRRNFFKLGGIGLASFIVGSGSLPNLSFQEELEQRVELLSVNSEIEGVLKPNNLPVYLFPLRSDYFYNENEPIKKLILGAENQLGFKGTYLFNVDGSLITTTILHSVTGNEKSLPIALLSEIQGFNFFNMRKNYTIPKVPIVGEYTLMSEFYPNKIINILLESIAMLEYQEKTDGFLAGQEYSFLDIIKNRWGSYVQGRTSTNNIVKGGGICAGATNLAKASFLAGAKFKEKWGHNTPYWIGPINPYNLTWQNSDATIGFNPNGEDFDFRWIMPKKHEKYYLNISASVFPNNMPRIKDGIGKLGDADARIIINYAWTPEKPKNKIENLKALIDGYNEYRKTGIVPNILKQSKTLEEIVSGEEKHTEKLKIFNIMYTKGKLPRFNQELETNPYINEVNTLGELINKYGEETTFEQFHHGKVSGIGTFLKETAWYLELDDKRKKGVEPGLGFSDILTYYDRNYKDSFFQCVGWVVLLAHLGQKESPKNVGGYPGRGPIDFVPDKIKNNLYITRTGSGGMIFERPESIDSYSVGDLFINYEYSPGHIGAIIGKKTVDLSKITQLKS